MTAKRKPTQSAQRRTATEGAITKKVRTSKPIVAKPVLSGRFAALDFETADYGRDSACALSVVIVDREKIVDSWTGLIRPPRREFVFTYLHGISWHDVQDKPVFGDLWPDVAQILERVDFVACFNSRLTLS